MAEFSTKSIDDLAQTELKQWFVRDCLANVALEHAGHDREEAVDLLQRAIRAIEAAQPAEEASGGLH